MRKLLVLGVIGCSTLISGCSSSFFGGADKAYISGSKTTAVTRDSGKSSVNLKQQNYPDIPNAPEVVDHGRPSLAPPGQGLEEKSKKQSNFNQQKEQLSKATKVAKKGFLKMPGSVKKYWPKVGLALKAAGYQIMDQDEMMSTYYILDKSQTNNKITRETPIYAVMLSQSTQGSDLSVMTKGNTPLPDGVRSVIFDKISANI